MVMAWLNRPKVGEILSRIGRDSRPVTYEILDERRVVHGYAIWYHLRWLRQRLGAARASHLQ
jgi:hypothetical protein